MSGAPTLRITTSGDREIVMTREFNAPRALVFDAYTKPELLKRWLGPRRWSLVVCEIDLTVGGNWRYVMRADDGTEMEMRGIYREIVPAERLVSTESFDPPWFPGESLNTLTLVEHGGRTTATTSVLYESKDVRDMVLLSGLESGVAESYDRLAELLASAGEHSVAGCHG